MNYYSSNGGEGGGRVPDLVKKNCLQLGKSGKKLHNNFKEKNCLHRKLKRKKIVFKTVLEREVSI